MISTSWRRVLLSALVAALFVLPIAAQAAPRAPRPHTSAAHLSNIAEPMRWLSRMWQGVAGLWQAATAAATGTSGSSTNGDSGASIDPDGHHG
jgi:hypothetical protein